MELIERIRADMLAARKLKNTEAVKSYSTLVGELELLSKRNNLLEVDDSLVVQTVKKFIENASQIIKQVSPRSEIRQAMEAEIMFLEQYLPTQLTEDEIKEVFESSGTTNIGEAMKYIKAKYEGQYDGKIASQIARSMF